MGDLFPKPGEKPWNLSAFGTKPQPRKGYRIQVEAHTGDPERALTRLHAFTNAVETKVRQLPAGETLDPGTLNITTINVAGQTIYRATFETKETKCQTRPR
ncbi:hypothetical protein ACNPON_17550 [Glutamicibacter sp. AGC13]